MAAVGSGGRGLAWSWADRQKALCQRKEAREASFPLQAQGSALGGTGKPVPWAAPEAKNCPK